MEKKFESSNPKIAFNVLCEKVMEIYLVYIAKYNSFRQKQIILPMILNKEKESWNYLVVKNLTALLKGITW